MDESSKETSCLASHGHGHGHGCGHGHGANRGRGCGHGVLLTKESSFRTQMLQEYNDELIQDSIHFAEIDSHANWQKAKEKIQPVKQQSIRGKSFLSLSASFSVSMSSFFSLIFFFMQLGLYLYFSQKVA
jgi:hypothetical protein